MKVYILKYNNVFSFFLKKFFIVFSTVKLLGYELQFQTSIMVKYIESLAIPGLKIWPTVKDWNISLKSESKLNNIIVEFKEVRHKI